jgi:hypothetical protein
MPRKPAGETPAPQEENALPSLMRLKEKHE